MSNEMQMRRHSIEGKRGASAHHRNPYYYLSEFTLLSPQQGRVTFSTRDGVLEVALTRYARRTTIIRTAR